MKKFWLRLMILILPTASFGQSLNPVQNLRYSEWCYNFNFLWDEPDSSGSTFIKYLVYQDSILIDSLANRYFSKGFDEGTYTIGVSAQYVEGESAIKEIPFSIPQTKKPFNLFINHRKDYISLGWAYPYYTFEVDYVEDYTPPYFTYYNDLYDSITYAIKYSWPANNDFVAEITQMRFFPSDEHGQGLEYHLKIFQGNDDPEIKYFSKINEIVFNEWNTTEIDPPLLVEATEDIWFCITILYDSANSNTGGIGLDDFWPNTGGNGGLWSIDETHWDVVTDGDWCISGYYTNALYYATEKATPINNEGVLVNQYNIYKNGEYLASTNNEFYTDYDFGQEDCNKYFEYGVEAVYSDCISDTSATGDTLICSTGIHESEIDHKSISISPNPASVSIYCKIVTSSKNSHFIIYSTMGVPMHKSLLQTRTAQFNIDVSTYPTGTYIAVLRSEQEIISTKIFLVK